MELKDLKTGMIIEQRSGKKAMILRGTANGDIVTGKTWHPLSVINDDLTGYCAKTDIVKVYQPQYNKDYKQKHWNKAELIWERPEYTYPMWFKNIDTKAVWKFTSLNVATLTVKAGSRSDLHSTSTFMRPHNEEEAWTQVEEPIEEMTLKEVCEKLGMTIKIIK